MTTTSPDRIAVLVITDGRRSYLDECVASLTRQVSGITEWWMYDDTGDDVYRSRLARQYTRFNHINGGKRQGFGGAIRASWQHLAAFSRAGWIFHVEQDFIFRTKIDLSQLVQVMTARPNLMQMALCRQAWNAEEKKAGGVVERWPDAFTDDVEAGFPFMRHRMFWTTNPSLYRRDLIHSGWPAVDRSEGVYTRQLLECGAVGVIPEEVEFAYWGKRGEHVLVEHIGRERAGNGY